MKKFISALSMAVVCFGFVVSSSFADNYVQSGLVGESSDDVCAWISYKKTTFKNTCDKLEQSCKQQGKGAGDNGVCKKFNDGALRCVARECPNGYVMPLVFNDKYDVPKGKDARILGYCYSESQAIEKCAGNCAGGGTCEPRYVDWKEANDMLITTSVVHMTGGRAFVGCFCKDCDVPEGVVCEDGECEFKGDITIACNNGNTKTFSLEFKIDKNAGRKEITEKITNDYRAEVNEFCKDKTVASVEFADGSVGSTSSQSDTVADSKSADSDKATKSGKSSKSDTANKADDVKAAREKLNTFFKKIDSDRSVWKNADGSFNATRLASDLTAGVVLGTVGGVVSGVLIKKSQVEKGFDALNCTVNGQKIAGWGDEFIVGLYR